MQAQAVDRASWTHCNLCDLNEATSSVPCLPGTSKAATLLHTCLAEVPNAILSVLPNGQRGPHGTAPSWLNGNMCQQRLCLHCSTCSKSSAHGGALISG
eukprot:CAMPEP_0115747946 /NCGR_PEP_ID=MMETSP0272-20121206/93422_1 /TAXON_ID=71861 /ORGANISM="Scrippsiella trochoidea, Strain CCMP3099" /LENGTH=98 /DNA_ID=CAMNT_0003192949 /DNA_START=288 /DNA_END=581 /DNA_ORIENTATION=-